MYKGLISAKQANGRLFFCEDVVLGMVDENIENCFQFDLNSPFGEAQSAESFDLLGYMEEATVGELLRRLSGDQEVVVGEVGLIFPL